jgi:alpha-aminoadipate carrier protein LysW
MTDQVSQKIICPDCEAEIVATTPWVVGDIVECQECGTEVEIMSLDPLKFRELVEEK